jgi:hypothetical protein
MASGERCSRGRAPGRKRQRPPAVGKVVSGPVAEEIPSREVWRVRSCAEQRAIGALGQDLLSSSPSLTWVRKTISLPGRSGASRTSRTLNPWRLR